LRRHLIVSRKLSGFARKIPRPLDDDGQDNCLHDEETIPVQMYIKNPQNKVAGKEPKRPYRNQDKYDRNRDINEIKKTLIFSKNRRARKGPERASLCRF